MIPIHRIDHSLFQPRREFNEQELHELAESIRQQGILQPLLVRQKGDRFELIAGERRLRAAQLAGLKEVPVLIKEADDRTVLELALIENLQREDLNPIEEALGYRQLIDRFGLRQEDIATRVGKSRATVANALRLLQLPPEVQELIRSGRLSTGHAKALLSLPTPEAQRQAAAYVLQKGLTVRQTEAYVGDLQRRNREPSSSKPQHEKTTPQTAFTRHLQQRLQERLGTRVCLRYRNGKGSIEIQFYSQDELERILQLLQIQLD